MKNKNKTLYVNSATAKVLSDYLIQKGFSKNKLNGILGEAADMLDISDFRLDVETYNRLWDFALAFTENPRLGIKLAKNPHNNEMGLVSHVFLIALHCKLDCDNTNAIILSLTKQCMLKLKLKGI